MKNLVENEPIRCCINCLNFSEIGSFHHNSHLYKCSNRYVIIGVCKLDGLQVSQWCVCDSWQDDA